jgi:hypothetical protein
VKAGDVFNFKVNVRFFFKPAGPVNVTDTLPTGLQPTTTPATWRATLANGSTLANQREAQLLQHTCRNML